MGVAAILRQQMSDRMNKQFTYLPRYAYSEGHLFTREVEDMEERKYIINIEVLARDIGRDIQTAIEMLGRTYASVVDFTLISNKLGTYQNRLLETDKELGVYRGLKDDMLRCIKLSNDLKQDCRAYEAACLKQAELIENYYFSNKISASTKHLQVYNQIFSKEQGKYNSVQPRLPKCILCPGRHHYMNYCQYDTTEKRRSRLVNIGRCRACTVPEYEHGILCSHRARCKYHPRENHMSWTCNGYNYNHPGPQKQILKCITEMQNKAKN